MKSEEISTMKTILYLRLSIISTFIFWLTWNFIYETWIQHSRVLWKSPQEKPHLHMYHETTWFLEAKYRLGKVCDYVSQYTFAIPFFWKCSHSEV